MKHSLPHADNLARSGTRSDARSDASFGCEIGRVIRMRDRMRLFKEEPRPSSQYVAHVLQQRLSFWFVSLGLHCGCGQLAGKDWGEPEPNPSPYCLAHPCRAYAEHSCLLENPYAACRVGHGMLHFLATWLRRRPASNSQLAASGRCAFGFAHRLRPTCTPDIRYFIFLPPKSRQRGFKHIGVSYGEGNIISIPQKNKETLKL